MLQETEISNSWDDSESEDNEINTDLDLNFKLESDLMTGTDRNYQTKTSNSFEFENKDSVKYNQSNSHTINQKCAKPVLFSAGKHKVGGFWRKSCQNLICMECFVSVSMLKGYKWNEKTCDYLFFRSYFGKRDILISKAIRSSKWLSFHCGCKGFSLEAPKFVSDLLSKPKWICKGCSK